MKTVYTVPFKPGDNIKHAQTGLQGTVKRIRRDLPVTALIQWTNGATQWLPVQSIAPIG